VAVAAVAALLTGCSAGVAGHAVAAASTGTTPPGMHQVGQPSPGGDPTATAVGDSVPTASARATAPVTSAAMTGESVRPATGAGSPTLTIDHSPVPPSSEPATSTAVDTAASSGPAPAQKLDRGVLLGRMRAGAATITGEIIEQSVSMRAAITDEATIKEKLTIKASHGQVTAFDARIAGTDLREIGPGDAARPSVYLRWVHERTFIGPQQVITSLGIADDQGRPWYEVTSTTDPMVAQFVLGMVHDPAVSVLLPLAADLVGAAFQLTDLGLQSEPVGTHEFRMSVDLLDVPALVNDLTADQLQQLRSGGEPVMTAFVWLDAQDRPVKLIAGYDAFEEQVSITETATHLNEAIRIEIPSAEDIVTG
jgi:hypothetical protein